METINLYSIPEEVIISGLTIRLRSRCLLYVRDNYGT